MPSTAKEGLLACVSTQRHRRFTALDPPPSICQHASSCPPFHRIERVFRRQARGYTKKMSTFLNAMMWAELDTETGQTSPTFD